MTYLRMIKILKYLFLISIFFVLNFDGVNAVDFDDFRENVFHELTLCIDFDFEDKQTYLYSFRLSNLGVPVTLAKGIMIFPVRITENNKVFITDFRGNKFPIESVEEKGLVIKFPPIPIENWGTYKFVILSEENVELVLNEKGFYSLIVEEVQGLFNNDYFDNGYLVMKLPDSFWYDSVLLSSSPQPSSMVSENGRLVLRYSKDVFTKNGELLYPHLIIEKKFDWNMFFNVFIAFLLAVITFSNIKKILIGLKEVYLFFLKLILYVMGVAKSLLCYLEKKFFSKDG